MLGNIQSDAHGPPLGPDDTKPSRGKKKRRKTLGCKPGIALLSYMHAAVPGPVSVWADHEHAHPPEVEEYAVLPAPHHLLRRLRRRRVEIQHLRLARIEKTAHT